MPPACQSRLKSSGTADIAPAGVIIFDNLIGNQAGLVRQSGIPGDRHQPVARPILLDVTERWKRVMKAGDQ